MKISKWAKMLFIFTYLAYAIFLYGPRFSIVILSFQGAHGGMIFPAKAFGDLYNRFDPRLEEAAIDPGASRFTTFKEILLPNIYPGLLGAGLFGFTLAQDELNRTMFLTHKQTLPMRIYGMRMLELNPDLYALGTMTTLMSFLIIATFLILGLTIAKRRFVDKKR